MAMVIKQSTSIDVAVGPFLDDTDGKTAETGLTLTQPDIRLKKNGGAWAQKAAAQTLSHEEAGWYELTLDATDTNTVGQLVVAVHESGALPVWREFCVVEEAIYDALFGASAAGFDASQRVNVGLWLGSAPNALQLGRVDAYVGAVASGVIAAASFAANALDAVWSTAARVLTAGTNIVLAKGTGVTGFNDPAASAVADAVWDEALSGHQSAGTTGEALDAASSGSAAGPGAIAWVVEVDDGADPIEGAHVWVSTDAAGSNVVAGSLITDSFGRVTFMLDAGTYYATIRKDGFNPVIADSFVVS